MPELRVRVASLSRARPIGRVSLLLDVLHESVFWLVVDHRLIIAGRGTGALDLGLVVSWVSLLVSGGVDDGEGNFNKRIGKCDSCTLLLL